MNTPSLNEINKTAKMDPILLTKHYKLKLMNDFMNIKYLNPKLKQSEIASQLNMSTSTIQKQRNDINMLSPYRINTNNVKKRPKKAKIDDNSDLKRPQMTSNDNKKIFVFKIFNNSEKIILRIVSFVLVIFSLEYHDFYSKTGSLSFQKSIDQLTCCCQLGIYLNIGAKVLSAKLAKVLILLTTTLTRCLYNAREQVAKSWEIRQKTTMR